MTGSKTEQKAMLDWTHPIAVYDGQGRGETGSEKSVTAIKMTCPSAGMQMTTI